MLVSIYFGKISKISEFKETNFYYMTGLPGISATPVSFPSLPPSRMVAGKVSINSYFV